MNTNDKTNNKDNDKNIPIKDKSDYNSTNNQSEILSSSRSIGKWWILRKK